MKKISLNKLNEMFAAVSADYSVYLPVDQADKTAKYEKWEEGKILSEAVNTLRSAKDFFFPQTENLMDFKVEGKNIEIIDNRSEAEDFVIFGARPCDVRSFGILDKVFLAEPVDSYYKSRREHGVVVSLACNRPTETCFCQTFGVDASEPEGDVAAWKDAEYMYFEAKTEKGTALLEKMAAFLEDGEAAKVDAIKSAIKTVLGKLPLKDLTTEKFDSADLMEVFNDAKWPELSQACLGCGTCTFVCPTCQCYDIKDFNNGREITRFRCWDSCMYSDFTMMSAGQPRLTQKERFRQRFMHKLVYYPANNNGLCSCVGCGRCLAKCPISMNIAKVMKTIGGKQHE